MLRPILNVYGLHKNGDLSMCKKKKNVKIEFTLGSVLLPPTGVAVTVPLIYFSG